VHANHEALTLHSPVAHPRSPWLTLLARCGCLKRHGVGEGEGELGADFTSLVLPRLKLQILVESSTFEGFAFQCTSSKASIKPHKNPLTSRYNVSGASGADKRPSHRPPLHRHPPTIASMPLPETSPHPNPSLCLIHSSAKRPI
jgi:hypothetical protein